MKLLVVRADTGEELLRESAWEGDLPRVGDIMELHLGPTRRWKVLEVDWVFEEAAITDHDDVPLKFTRVLVTEFEGAPDVSGHVADPMCECGHRQSLHSPIGCKGKAGFCECRGFRLHK